MTDPTAKRDVPAQFSLLGGPLYELGRRAKLVRDDSNTVPLGLALGVGTWAVLVVLAAMGGLGHAFFSLSAIAGHVRLLLVIPLAFLCEAWVNPRMKVFVDTIIQSGVVPGAARPALDSEVTRIVRWKNSWLPDVVCLVAGVLMSFAASPLDGTGGTFALDPRGHASATPMASLWYWYVCLPLFRFVLLRWMWRLALWAWFLRRVARLELRLVPTHPDGAGGLGYLEVTQMHFLPLVLAISALQAAVHAEAIASRQMPLEALYPGGAVLLLVDVTLFVAPTFAFIPKLWAARIKGLSDYMIFASRYVGGFDRKWVRADAPSETSLLGTPDLQSLADLANSVAIVKNMRIVPITVGLLRDFAIVALLPAVPLVLLKYPMTELIQKFIERFLGL